MPRNETNIRRERARSANHWVCTHATACTLREFLTVLTSKGVRARSGCQMIIMIVRNEKFAYTTFRADMHADRMRHATCSHKNEHGDPKAVLPCSVWQRVAEITGETLTTFVQYRGTLTNKTDVQMACSSKKHSVVKMQQGCLGEPAVQGLRSAFFIILLKLRCIRKR